MWVGTRLLTFGNQAEDMENVPIGIYQIVSKLLGGWFWTPCFSLELPLLLYKEHLVVRLEASG